MDSIYTGNPPDVVRFHTFIGNEESLRPKTGAKSPLPSNRKRAFCMLSLQAIGPGGVLGHLGVTLLPGGAVGQDVDLDLLLGAGGPDDQAGAVGHLVAQDVGPGQLHSGLLAALHTDHAAVLVVLLRLDGLKKMAELMANLRQNPPTEIAGVAVKEQKDYKDINSRRILCPRLS